MKSFVQRFQRRLKPLGRGAQPRSPLRHIVANWFSMYACAISLEKIPLSRVEQPRFHQRHCCNSVAIFLKWSRCTTLSVALRQLFASLPQPTTAKLLAQILWTHFRADCRSLLSTRQERLLRHHSPRSSLTICWASHTSHTSPLLTHSRPLTHIAAHRP